MGVSEAGSGSGAAGGTRTKPQLAASSHTGQKTASCSAVGHRASRPGKGMPELTHLLCWHCLTHKFGNCDSYLLRTKMCGHWPTETLQSHISEVVCVYLPHHLCASWAAAANAQECWDCCLPLHQFLIKGYRHPRTCFKCCCSLGAISWGKSPEGSSILPCPHARSWVEAAGFWRSPAEPQPHPMPCSLPTASGLAPELRWDQQPSHHGGLLQASAPTALPTCVTRLTQ